MNEIKNKVYLERIEVSGKELEYCYQVEGHIQQFFSEKSFVIVYDEDLSIVPNAVLAIPFVCNVLPIIWLENAELIIPELDEDFYNSISKFKKGYVDMYPEAEFKGRVTVEKIINCQRDSCSGVATFFSGGLDATTTLLRHLDEKPDLISIWGADIAFDNVEGWKPIQKAIDEAAIEYGVKHINIHSSFRQFDREWELDKAHRAELHDGWWHGVKHGIGLIGHAAPYAWLHGLEKVYIASSFTEADNVTCASHPSIDNNVFYCGCKTVHDGFELDRQEKAHYIVSQKKKGHLPKVIPLHVCWRSKDGYNCNKCEKCYRTIVEIWVEGGKPEEFGLSIDTGIVDSIKELMMYRFFYSDVEKSYWSGIQRKMRNNHDILKREEYFHDFRWIEKFNFEEPEKNWCRKWSRIKSVHGIRGKLAEFEFYQKLHEWKIKVRGK